MLTGSGAYVAHCVLMVIDGNYGDFKGVALKHRNRWLIRSTAHLDAAGDKSASK
uniref:Uncharacterized protein n=1 Tax=Anguilla anguilla TaxID=7936 RepID=A0A0E9UYC6_ANGAN